MISSSGETGQLKKTEQDRNPAPFSSCGFVTRRGIYYYRALTPLPPTVQVPILPPVDT